ncbi:major facilitator superfamily domain-containing protein [Leucosporidium creatinivorum]|uniref:Major facilitator superfamily domain-containing protein n=1 Tax=Leucosporidium creatinivorum TaxID=106004 RepID=A0A1Y2D7A6_9BASI|nr:major facilitator superfamily domain-containing protein [Leucosporidium creatinivorum]
MADLVQPLQHGIELSVLPGSSTTTQPPSRDVSPSSSTRRLKDLEAEQQAGSLPPIDGGKHAWVFLASAFMVEMFVWAYGFSFGTVSLHLSTHAPFDESSLTAIGAVGTVALAIEYMLPIGLIVVFRRYPDWVRTILWSAVVLSCGSMLVSSWATAVWHLILLQGVCGGIAGGVLYTPVLIWLSEWWVVRRGMASGIIFAGTGVGGFCLPFLIGGLLERVGFSWMCRIWALITFTIYVGCMFSLRPRLPVSKPEQRAPWLSRGTDLSFAWNPIVLLMSATTFIFSLAFFAVSLLLTTYVDSISSSSSANAVLAVLNVSTTVSQLGIGWASDRFEAAYIMASIAFISCLSSLASWGFADTLGKVFGFAVLFGGFSGICALWSDTGRDVAGGDPNVSTAIVAIYSVFRGSASIIGPIIGSSLYRGNQATEDTQWGMHGFRDVMIFAVGVTTFASAVMGLGFKATKKYKVHSA